MLIALLASALACAPDAEHADPLARRDAVEACRAVTSTASWNEGGAHPVTEAHLRAWAADEDRRVRRALYFLIADLGDPALQPVAAELLLAAVEGGETDRRALRPALAALHHAARRGLFSAERAWRAGRPHLADPEGPGIAAAVSLGKLAALSPEHADPHAAFDAVVAVHPEVAWGFAWQWREALGADEARLVALLDASVGLHGGLLRHWAAHHPGALARVLSEWAPRAEPDRLAALVDLLGEVDGEVAEALGTPPSVDRAP